MTASLAESASEPASRRGQAAGAGPCRINPNRLGSASFSSRGTRKYSVPAGARVTSRRASSPRTLRPCGTSLGSAAYEPFDARPVAAGLLADDLQLGARAVAFGNGAAPAGAGQYGVAQGHDFSFPRCGWPPGVAHVHLRCCWSPYPLATPVEVTLPSPL